MAAQTKRCEENDGKQTGDVAQCQHVQSTIHQSTISKVNLYVCLMQRHTGVQL